MSVQKESTDSIAERLLVLIRKKPGRFWAFDELSRLLKTDHATINNALHLLAERDYRLRVRASSGVAFVNAPDHLTGIEIGNGLKTTTIGRKILAFQTVQSTNDIAATQAEHGAPEGTLVIAEHQTKGRGRLGRSWYSPPGTGVYLSIVLRPGFKPEDAPGLSLMAALALAETLENFCPGGVQIKWPNDVLLGERKAAGILTELSAERDKINHVVIGVGINVNQGVGHFPAELRNTATSVRRFLKRKVPRVKIVQDFLYHFEREYGLYKKHRLSKGLRRLRRYSSLIGREVTVQAGNQRLIGTAHDIDAHGRLVLDCDGRKVAVAAGEVTVVKK